MWDVPEIQSFCFKWSPDSASILYTSTPSGAEWDMHSCTTHRFPFHKWHWPVPADWCSSTYPRKSCEHSPLQHGAGTKKQRAVAAYSPDPLKPQKLFYHLPGATGQTRNQFLEINEMAEEQAFRNNPNKPIFILSCSKSFLREQHMQLLQSPAILLAILLCTW